MFSVYVQIRLKLPMQCSLTDVITDALEVSIKSFTIINIICHPEHIIILLSSSLKIFTTTGNITIDTLIHPPYFSSKA